MNLMQAAYILALFLCVAYGFRLGGRTGRAGGAIFVAASGLTGVAAMLNPTWASTSYAVFAVDAACLLALALLAAKSNRFWPIWASGFQIVAVATHIATFWIPDIVPRAYHAILSVWSIPIMGVMVAGTRMDQKYERDAAPRG